jgi:hypothetical protein
MLVLIVEDILLLLIRTVDPATTGWHEVATADRFYYGVGWKNLSNLKSQDKYEWK